MNLFKEKYRPGNYSQEEMTNYLEAGVVIAKRKRYIQNNADKLSQAQIAKELGISTRTLYTLSSGMVKKKHVYAVMPMRRGATILDTETGIYHESVTELAKAHNIHKGTMRAFIVGYRKHDYYFNRFKIV